MKRIVTMTAVVLMAGAVGKAAVLPGPMLLCHRTANEDVPENTLESLEEAALLGCNVIEMDLRRTLDGRIVLNHDGILERLTDGVGDVEASYFGDLEQRDEGSWMGERFAGLRMVQLEDALRLARAMDVRLVLDIKTRGIGADVLRTVEREGMLERVQFNGEWADVKQMYPAATDAGAETTWVQPGVTAEQVMEYHRQGRAVVANFSANKHEMDLAGMKAAVAAGVDGINVDYPRLGADAVGRPVERRLRALIELGNQGSSKARSEAILQLGRYRGFPFLEDEFRRWLLDEDDRVSRAAAVVLAKARPRSSPDTFGEALRSEHTNVRANTAWALGMLQANAKVLTPLLNDKDPLVLEQTLFALAHMPGEVSADVLLPLLSHQDSRVRAGAAVALARHQPDAALRTVPKQLRIEMKTERAIYDDYVQRGRLKLTQAEIGAITSSFRCQMKMVQAISMIEGEKATRELEVQAFRASEDFSQMNGVVAAFELWDRIGANPSVAVQALESEDVEVADRAEWMLVQAGGKVLPAVRGALENSDMKVRVRAMHIVAWHGDQGSLAKLRTMAAAGGSDAEVAAWAVEKIEAVRGK